MPGLILSAHAWFGYGHKPISESRPSARSSGPRRNAHVRDGYEVLPGSPIMCPDRALVEVLANNDDRGFARHRYRSA